MTSKDPKTLRSYNVAIDNFENFCVEKYGKADFVSELKDYDSDGIFDVLQSWINWNGDLASKFNEDSIFTNQKYLYHRGSNYINKISMRN